MSNREILTVSAHASLKPPETLSRLDELAKED
jgi:hypothetical protein